MHKRIMKRLSLNHLSLTRQPLFWLAIGVPLVCFCVFGGIAWQGNSFHFSAAGFNSFIEISRLPLGLLALAIPLTALVTSMHRSVQMEKQITEAQNKNTADLYYAHKRFFLEQIKDIDFLTQTLNLYHSLYPAMSVSTFDASKNNEIVDQFININNEISKLIPPPPYSLGVKNFSPIAEGILKAIQNKRFILTTPIKVRLEPYLDSADETLQRRLRTEVASIIKELDHLTIVVTERPLKPYLRN